MFITNVNPINYNNYRNINIFKGYPQTDENSIILQRAELKRLRAGQIQQEAFDIRARYTNIKTYGYSLSLDLEQKYFLVRRLRKECEGAHSYFNKDNGSYSRTFLKDKDEPRTLKMVETQDGKPIRETTFLNDKDDCVFVWETNKSDNTKNFYAFSDGKLTKYAMGIKKNNYCTTIKKEYCFDGALICEYRENVEEYPDGRMHTERAYVADGPKLTNYYEDELRLPNGEISCDKVYKFDKRDFFIRYYQNYNLEMPKFYSADKIFEYEDGNFINYKYNFLNLGKESSCDELYVYKNNKFFKFYENLKLGTSDKPSYDAFMVVKNGRLSKIK